VTVARLAAVALIAPLALAATGCGGAASGKHARTTRPVALTQAASTPRPPAPPPGRFLAVDRRARSVTVTLIAAYDAANEGFNFDGYSRTLLWRVPLGWTVHVVCKNRGPLRHSCAVVRGPDTARPAFRGASTPQPLIGLEAGHTATFTFRASRAGVYRFVCLVPGHELARMWDVLQITRGGKPAVVDLQAR